MRTTVFGKQLVLDNGGKFVGINIGYNFLSEHECGVDTMLNCINTNPYKVYRELEKYNMVNRKIKMGKINKDIKAKKQRWENTPFRGHLISPYCDYIIKRGVIIDNEDMVKSNKTTQLNNGSTYSILVIGGSYTIDMFRKILGNRKKFLESELLYTNDYNYKAGDNFGFLINKGWEKNKDTSKLLAGAWDDSHGVLLIISDKYREVVDDIEKALLAGRLAMVDQEPRLFADKGLSLIDLEQAYLTGRR